MQKGINLKNQLNKVEHAETSILTQISEIFLQDTFAENNVLRNLRNSVIHTEEVKLVHFNDNNIYDIKSIEKLSIKYRLRFLPTKFYKYEFPAEAVLNIREIERKNDLTLKEFYILAPKEAFDLQDANADPLLFAKLSDSKFYLIHSWGNDLSKYRAIVNYPLRGISEFLISTLVFAFVFQFLIPTSVMGIAPDKVMIFRLWLTTHCFIGFFAFFILLGSLTHQQFSNSSWKSKYFNK